MCVCTLKRKVKFKRSVKMGLTLTEKIIKQHIIDGEMIKGTEIGLKIDQAWTG